MPLYRYANQKLHKDFEMAVAEFARTGKIVEYTVTPVYGAHKSIPIHLECVAKIDGKIKLKDKILNAEPIPEFLK